MTRSRKRGFVPSVSWLIMRGWVVPRGTGKLVVIGWSRWFSSIASPPPISRTKSCNTWFARSVAGSSLLRVCWGISPGLTMVSTARRRPSISPGRLALGRTARQWNRHPDGGSGADAERVFGDCWSTTYESKADSARLVASQALARLGHTPGFIAGRLSNAVPPFFARFAPRGLVAAITARVMGPKILQKSYAELRRLP